MTEKNLENTAEENSSKKMSRDEIVYLLFETGVFTKDEAIANTKDKKYLERYEGFQIASLSDFEWISWDSPY